VLLLTRVLPFPVLGSIQNSKDPKRPGSVGSEGLNYPEDRTMQHHQEETHVLINLGQSSSLLWPLHNVPTCVLSELLCISTRCSWFWKFRALRRLKILLLIYGEFLNSPFFSAVTCDWTPGQNGTVIDHQTPYQQAFFIINCEIHNNNIYKTSTYASQPVSLISTTQKWLKNAYALILLQVCALNNPWSLLLVLWTPGDSH